MIKYMISALDEDFPQLKFSITPSFKAPKYKTDDFPIHDWHCMTLSKCSTTVHVPDTRLAYIKVEIHHSVKPLFVLVSTPRAIIQDLSEDNPQHLDYLGTVMCFQQRQIDHMWAHLGTALVELATT